MKLDQPSFTKASWPATRYHVKTGLVCQGSFFLPTVWSPEQHDEGNVFYGSDSLQLWILQDLLRRIIPKVFINESFPSCWIPTIVRGLLQPATAKQAIVNTLINYKSKDCRSPKEPQRSLVSSMLSAGQANHGPTPLLTQHLLKGRWDSQPQLPVSRSMESQEVMSLSTSLSWAHLELTVWRVQQSWGRGWPQW